MPSRALPASIEPPAITSRATPLPAPPASPRALPPAGDLPATLPVAAKSPGNVLRLRGEYWEVGYKGRSALVEDCRGLRYIAVLIRDTRPPAGPIHARELVAVATGQDLGVIELETRDYVLDPTARGQLMERLEEIASNRDRAIAIGALDKATALDAEHERIADELARAGSGRGRRATFNHEGEKARKAVGKAITEAIARVSAAPELTALAEHLRSSVRKGQWLSYSGGDDWNIHFSAPLRQK